MADKELVTQVIEFYLLTVEANCIRWIGYFWTRNCCQSKIEESRFQSCIASKYIFDLHVCTPGPNAGAWLKDRERTCYLLCPVSVEVDREFRSRSEAYLLTPLQLTSLVPIACLSQLKHAQLLQVAWMIKTQAGASTCILDMGCPEAKQIRSWLSLPKAIRTPHIIFSACDTWLLFLVIASFM